jgi:hypothetical protein
VGHLIEGEAIPQFPRSQAKDPARIAGKPLLHLGKELINVDVDGDGGVIEIPLKDAIRTINGTVDDEIDDLIATADAMTGPGAPLHEPAFPSRDQEAVLPFTDGILERTEPAGGILGAAYHGHGNSPRSAQNSLCHGVSRSPSIQENPPQLISCHEFPMPSIGSFSAFRKSLKKALFITKSTERYFVPQLVYDHMNICVEERIQANPKS